MRSSADSAARLRGASVGAASGAVSIAAHGFGGGPVAVGSASLTLLMAACALIGVVVATGRGGLGLLVISLAGGQVIGHAALAVSGPHRHGSAMSPAMLGAHLVAIAVGALVIRGAEVALGRVSARMRRIVVALVRWFTVERRGRIVCVSAVRVVVQRVHCVGLRWRGPPWVFVSSHHPVIPVLP
ncbi:hypothetical protein [Nocardia sp. NPDC051570]|uniref:hypothetical protein n=1 Tax=Nocardia sp. NPDC051570 TaxID=3364324 RepID=UPI0037A1B657